MVSSGLVGPFYKQERLYWYNKLMKNVSNTDYIDWDSKWAYPLQWIQESQPARLEYQQWCHRVNLAMIGRPWKNLYQDELESNIATLDDETLKARLRKQCLQLPEGKSFCLADAVQTCANQLAAGVDTYEYQVNDPYGIIDDDTEAKLAACCSQDYTENKLGLAASLYTRDLRRYGLCAVLVSYCPETERNTVTRINPKNTWVDTMYSATGNERFRGYSTMIDWHTLKKMIEDHGDEINTDLKIPRETIFDEDGKFKESKKEAKVRRGKLKTLNDLDIYVGDINKLATSPAFQGFDSQFYWEYDHDLRNCYNLNWYHSFATDPKAQTKSGYHGMDVELTVMYDLNRGIEFKIINRRFVIAYNKEAFKRQVMFPIYNAYSDTVDYKMDEIHLGCPLIFEFEDQDARDKFAYPTSNLFHLLDLHDELCAWKAKRSHVSKLLAILRITTNGADAASLRGVMNVMGVVLDDIQGNITSMNLEYSYDPIDSQIALLEQTIKERLNAYNQFDAMQAMGDRASAAESGMAVGAIAQGLSTLQNALMDLYADIARQLILNRVVYSPNSEFPVNNDGDYSSITIQEMALEAVITVKSKMAKRVQERALATNALALLPTVQGIFSDQGIAMLVEQATMGNIPRKMAATFINPPQPDPNEVALAQQQAQNDAMALQQNQQMYLDNPIPYEVNNAMGGASSPEEIDEMIAQVSQSPEGTDVSIDALQMPEQDLGMVANLQGMTSDLGSDLANPAGVV